jgi:SSS family solute:Na+ symporter
MMRVRSALDAWWELASIFSGGMLGLFLLGLISRRAGNAGAVTGVLAGVLVILWMSLSPRFTGSWEAWRSPFHNFMVIVIGTLVILLLGLIISRFTRNSGSAKTNRQAAVSAPSNP